MLPFSPPSVISIKRHRDVAGTPDDILVDNIPYTKRGGSPWATTARNVTSPPHHPNDMMPPGPSGPFKRLDDSPWTERRRQRLRLDNRDGEVLYATLEEEGTKQKGKEDIEYGYEEYMRIDSMGGYSALHPPVTMPMVDFGTCTSGFTWASVAWFYGKDWK